MDNIENFESIYVVARNITVWVPRQYVDNPHQHFSVIYMHDGQNLFDAFVEAENSWSADKTAQALINAGKIAPFIIVGIWNSPIRRIEYFPAKAAHYFSARDWEIDNDLRRELGEPIEMAYQGDAYLQFIVTELKPYIDAHYRTLPDKDHTMMAGSSMGALISLYAVAEYPDVFGKVACLSTHWPVLFNNTEMSLSESIRRYMRDAFPRAGSPHMYFDYGTEMLDQYYEVHQLLVDNIMQAKGYLSGRDWVTRKCSGAAHDEKSWAKRLDQVFMFLMA